MNGKNDQRFDHPVTIFKSEHEVVATSFESDTNLNYVSSTTQILNTKTKIRNCSITSVCSKLDLRPTKYWETLTHMVKGNIGCGLLATGMAFKNGGLLFSLFLVFFLGFISTYNQYILVTMANKIKKKYNCQTMGFADTIGMAFEDGPPLFQKTANLARFSIKIFIIVTQLGFCCVYIMFLSQSLQQICKSRGIDIDLHVITVLILPVIWATALIRELKYIAPLSTIANVSTFAALGLILYHSTRDLPAISERKLIESWDKLPLCFGTIVYSLEGISLVLPLQQNMKKNERFLGIAGVLNLSLSFVILLIAAIGFFGYLKFGDNVAESLTYNLNAQDIVTQVVIIFMVIGILCTYALQFFVPIRLLLPIVNRWSSSLPYSQSHTYEYILRSVLVLFTFIIAVLIPHLDLFVSLVGAVGGTFLALIYTPLADLSRRKKSNYGLYGWRVIIVALSLVIGICGFAVGTTMSLKGIIEALKKDFKKV